MSAPALSLEPVPPQPAHRERAILTPTSELSWQGLTADQAQILYQLIHEHRADITHRWSHGIFDGLCTSLCEIDRAGGAYIRRGYSRPL